MTLRYITSSYKHRVSEIETAFIQNLQLKRLEFIEVISLHMNVISQVVVCRQEHCHFPKQLLEKNHKSEWNFHFNTKRKTEKFRKFNLRIHSHKFGISYILLFTFLTLHTYRI